VYFAFAALAAGPLIGCKSYDPLFCDENNPCPDPDRPFCDLRGEYPASEGVAKTCIPEPPDLEPDAGDGATGPDGGDGPDAAAKRRVVDLAIGKNRSCAILDDGGLRCWGSNEDGLLGYPANIPAVGDDEHPFEVGDVPTGGPVKQIALADEFACVLYMAGNVRCFGDNGGDLGYGHVDEVGRTPADVPDVSLGEPAVQIAAGAFHTCALLESGSVRCWGTNGLGALGYGDDEQSVGDNEVPSDKPAIEVGGAVSFLTVGILHTCAILGGGDGRVRCWGMGLDGVLGYGNTTTIGDTEPPSSAGDVDVGGEVAAIQSYGAANCVILSSGSARCWGDGGQILGSTNPSDWGDDEPAGAAPVVRLGGSPAQVAGGPKCMILSDGSVRCWGKNEVGQLGLGHLDTIGDDQDEIIERGRLSLGENAVLLARGFVEYHACALLADGGVRCWGLNASGQLGLGHQENIGDDEVPSDQPPIRIFD
jgi:alpha-tubulin suppressor-like RCC1 family protein